MRFIFKIFAVIAILGCTGSAAYGQHTVPGGAVNSTDAAQEFTVIVYENSDSTLLSLGKNVSTRGILGDSWRSIKNAYRNTVIGSISGISAEILQTGVNWLIETLRDKKQDWMEQARKDCRYTKHLPMQRQITDFYATTSTRGAMDLDSIVFDGFGCQQFLTYNNPATNKRERLLVFDMKCSLRKDDVGRNRMIHHSKFEVVVDHLFFNPYLCNIPNDSLTSANSSLRIPFSFDSRKDLVFNVKARVSSSWMNEAIQAVNDQLLGEFDITARIPDGSYIQTGDWYPGYFVYINPTDENIAHYELSRKQVDEMKRMGKVVSVTGESFLVPRSFVGYENKDSDTRIWGTGQYKVDMDISETCDINPEYYLEPVAPGARAQMPPANMTGGDGRQQKPLTVAQMSKGRKWNDNWKPEWKKMKKRRRRPSLGQRIMTSLNMKYGNFRWVNTILDPVTTVILQQETAALNGWTDSWLNIGSQAAAANTQKPAGQGGQGQGQGQSGQGQGGQGGQGKNPQKHKDNREITASENTLNPNSKAVPPARKRGFNNETNKCSPNRWRLYFLLTLTSLC